LTHRLARAQYTPVPAGTNIHCNIKVKQMTTLQLQQARMHQRFGVIAKSPVCLWTGSVV